FPPSVSYSCRSGTYFRRSGTYSAPSGTYSACADRVGGWVYDVLRDAKCNESTAAPSGPRAKVGSRHFPAKKCYKATAGGGKLADIDFLDGSGEHHHTGHLKALRIS